MTEKFISTTTALIDAFGKVETANIFDNEVMTAFSNMFGYKNIESFCKAYTMQHKSSISRSQIQTFTDIITTKYNVLVQKNRKPGKKLEKSGKLSSLFLLVDFSILICSYLNYDDLNNLSQVNKMCNMNARLKTLINNMQDRESKNVIIHDKFIKKLRTHNDYSYLSLIYKYEHVEIDIIMMIIIIVCLMNIQNYLKINHLIMLKKM